MLGIIIYYFLHSLIHSGIRIWEFVHLGQQFLGT